MNKLYIIDAINYLFRAYYAIGPMTSSSGQPSGALYGFIRSIQKLIKTTNPTHLVCVFDGPENKKARQELFKDYKSHRKQAPEDLVAQFDLAFQFCELSGIPLLCIPQVEADDVMATIAIWAKKQHSNAYLCTSDKDLTQLVDDQIFVLHPHKDYMLVDEAKVQEIFGIPPCQILDFLAITGDSSDNIPGIPGFGPKTAVSLLQEFGTLEEILKHPEKVKGEKKQQTLIDHKETAILSKKLATLNLDVEIPKDPDFYKLTKPKTDQLRTFYHEMQFNSLLRELEASSPQQEVSTSETTQNKFLYQTISSDQELDDLLTQLSTEKEIILDTETTSVEPLKADLVGIGFATIPGKAWYVPLNGSIDKEIALEKLKKFFLNFKESFVGHNIKYDWHVLKNHGITIPRISFDTMVASYVLEPHVRRHNLDDLTLEKFQHVKIPLENLIGKGSKQITMDQVPIENVKNYCCEDVDYTCRLKNLFAQELKENSLEDLFYKIEMPLLPILANMEREGIYLDTEKLKTIGDHLLHNLEKIKEKIYTEVGFTFNLNSPKQLSEVLFDTLGLPRPTKAKTAFSTGADILEDLATDNPIVQDILIYRSLEKLRTTYIEALPQQVLPQTGRIHCTFNQSVTATGRLSCQDPNLQNIPVRTKEGNSIRSCFRPQNNNCSFIGADYSQIELRLLAHFSKDPELITAFKNKEDIHAHTASRIFNLPVTMITPDMRAMAKTVNFGILYGQGPFGLSQQLHISMREASEFIKTYFERYPKISQFLDLCKQEALKNGFSKTLTGRKRPILDLSNKNANIRAAAERLAINTPLQGTAADLIKLAMIAIDKEIKENNLQGKMILQIHDELIFEVPDSEVEIFKKIIKTKMENVFTLSVPLTVDISVGKNWSEC